MKKKKLLVQIKDLIEENVKLKSDLASYGDVDIEKLKSEQENLVEENIRLNREIDKKVKLLSRIDSALERLEKEILLPDEENGQAETDLEKAQSVSEGLTADAEVNTESDDNAAANQKDEFADYAEDVLKYVQLKVDVFLNREKETPQFLNIALLQVFDSFKTNVAALVDNKTDFEVFVESVDKCVYEILDFIKLIDNGAEQQ